MPVKSVKLQRKVALVLEQFRTIFRFEKLKKYINSHVIRCFMC